MTTFGKLFPEYFGYSLRYRGKQIRIDFSYRSQLLNRILGWQDGQYANMCPGFFGSEYPLQAYIRSLL